MTRHRRCFDAFEIAGQRYEFVGEIAHTRKDGKLTILVTWQAPCLDCKQPFHTTKPDKPAPASPTRRCRACSQVWLDKQAAKRLMRNGDMPDDTAPFTPAWMISAETERSDPRTAPLAPAPPASETPAVAPVPASPRARQPSETKRKPGVFTDR